MARYRLTPEVAEGLTPLSKLPTDDVRELAKEIDQKLAVRLAIEDDVEELLRDSPTLRALPPEDFVKLSEAFAGLHLLRFSASKSISEVVSDIAEAFRDLSFDQAALDTLKENATTILGIKVLQTSVKAWTLVDDHGTIYLTSRVITDIRPVFDDDIDQPLRASLVTHTLKLNVRTDGRQRMLYIVTDNADLKELRDNIDRALAKGTSLKAMVRNHPDHWFGASLVEDSEDE